MRLRTNFVLYSYVILCDDYNLIMLQKPAHLLHKS